MRRLYQPTKTLLVLCAGLLTSVRGPAQQNLVRIVTISPTAGPEGTRIRITGEHLQDATAVLFGQLRSDFRITSQDELVAIVPHRATTSPITVVTRQGRWESPFALAVVNDPRIPEEVSYKSGY